MSTAANTNRVTCQSCLRAITLDKDGNVRKHKISRDFGVCAGSGKAAHTH